MKKPAYILTVIFLLNVLFSNAQNYQWAHGFGGPSYYSQGNSIATDAQGNVYVTGTFGDSIDFDPDTGSAYLYPNNFGMTAFIAKYDSSGNYIWAKSLSENPYGESITEKIVVNNTGIYLTGHFALWIDFDPGPGTSILSSTGGFNGDEDIFIAHYDLNGNYLWAKSMGGIGEDEALDMAVDNNGNSYITGYFRDTVDLDPDIGIATFISNGFQDSFFAKYDANGNYVWAYDLCDSNSAAYNPTIELDNTNNDIYISGAFTGTIDFDRGLGTFYITDNNYSLRYVAKYDTSGGFIWAGSISAASGINISDIHIDSTGSNDILICGSFEGVADFDLSNGVFSVNPNNSYSVIYFAKYSSSGNLIWVRQTNSTGILGVGKGIITDYNGSVYLTGEFSGSTDFDPGAGISNLIANGSSRDIFFAKYDSSGNYIWARGMGGLYTDAPNSITLDPFGSIYLTGYFTNSMDADPDAGVAQLNPAISQNIFIGKYANTLTGIYEGEKGNTSSLVVYPNPANEIITVINKENNPTFHSKIIIINSIGAIVYQKFFSISLQPLKININFLPPGLYCITSVEKTKTVSTKFVKK